MSSNTNGVPVTYTIENDINESVNFYPAGEILKAIAPLLANNTFKDVVISRNGIVIFRNGTAQKNLLRFVADVVSA